MQLWRKPLKESEIIPEARRQDFIEQVFWNVEAIIAVNTRLRDALNKRQKSYAVVEQIGDVLIEAVPHFHPFVSYGAHQLYGKYEFEKEKSANPTFARFVEVCRIAIHGQMDYSQKRSLTRSSRRRNGGRSQENWS